MTTETTTKAALRPLMAEDADTVAAIFYDGVLHGTAPHYSEEERQAWAGPRPDPRTMENACFPEMMQVSCFCGSLVSNRVLSHMLVVPL